MGQPEKQDPLQISKGWKERVRLNPLRIPYPYPYGLNPLLKSTPPTKRSINCRKFSENIFEAIFFNYLFSFWASYGNGHIKTLPEAHICDYYILVQSSQQACIL